MTTVDTQKIHRNKFKSSLEENNIMQGFSIFLSFVTTYAELIVYWDTVVRNNSLRLYRPLTPFPTVLTSCRTTAQKHNEKTNIDRTHLPCSELFSFTGTPAVCMHVSPLFCYICRWMWPESIHRKYTEKLHCKDPSCFPFVGTTISFLCPTSMPGNHSCFLHLYKFVISKLSCEWNHTACNCMSLLGMP